MLLNPCIPKGNALDAVHRSNILYFLIKFKHLVVLTNKIQTVLLFQRIIKFNGKMQLDSLNYYRAALVGKLPQILIVTWKTNWVFYLKKEILIWLFFGFSLCGRKDYSLK